MFRKLHLKMTLFCTAVTGGILILMALTGLRVFESLLGKNDTASYEKTVSSVLAYLDGQNILDYDTINRLQIIIFIRFLSMTEEPFIPDIIVQKRRL